MQILADFGVLFTFGRNTMQSVNVVQVITTRLVMENLTSTSSSSRMNDAGTPSKHMVIMQYTAKPKVNILSFQTIIVYWNECPH